MKTIHIRKATNVASYTASCDGYDLVTSRDPGWAACRKLAEAGCTGPVRITAPNSETISFEGTIEHFAALSTSDNPKSSLKITKYRPWGSNIA